MPAPRPPRVEGLDLARYLALVGMILVNFRIALGGAEPPPSPLALLEGRAAALFVVLAGMGVGLGALRGALDRALLWKRALFLFAVGLLNATIFEADILHFYALYFALGAFALHATTRGLWALSAASVAGFFALLFFLDYERGWDWSTLGYTDFWTARGFARHLLFNGWHPVLPWIAFLLAGMALARADWDRTAAVAKRGALAAGVAILGQVASTYARESIGDPELVELFGTAPIPPMPLYSLVAGATAIAVICGAVLLAPALARLGVLALLVPAGRQTLTLYVAHILLGMGLLDALGMLESGAGTPVVVLASLAFLAPATLHAWLRARSGKRGVLETLMRRVAG